MSGTSSDCAERLFLSMVRAMGGGVQGPRMVVMWSRAAKRRAKRQGAIGQDLCRDAKLRMPEGI